MATTRSAAAGEASPAADPRASTSGLRIRSRSRSPKELAAAKVPLGRRSSLIYPPCPDLGSCPERESTRPLGTTPVRAPVSDPKKNKHNQTKHMPNSKSRDSSYQRPQASAGDLSPARAPATFSTSTTLSCARRAWHLPGGRRPALPLPRHRLAAVGVGSGVHIPVMSDDGVPP